MARLAIVSGGMDSITMLYQFRAEISHVLNFVYGSKHNKQETYWAEHHASRLGKPFFRIPLDFIAKHYKSNLLETGGQIPDGHYADENMKQTVVPFRNGVMLSIAAGFAESLGCDSVAIANHFGDHAIYPDCRASFISAMNQAIQMGTWAEIQLFAPYTNLSKRDIALIGKDIDVPYHQTYTCYKGSPKHCGTCGSCTERKEALDGFDPTEYLAKISYSTGS